MYRHLIFLVVNFQFLRCKQLQSLKKVAASPPKVGLPGKSGNPKCQPGGSAKQNSEF